MPKFNLDWQEDAACAASPINVTRSVTKVSAKVKFKGYENLLPSIPIPPRKSPSIQVRPNSHYHSSSILDRSFTARSTPMRHFASKGKIAIGRTA